VLRVQWLHLFVADFSAGPLGGDRSWHRMAGWPVPGSPATHFITTPFFPFVAMPETTLRVPAMLTQADADAVMFELQDLPCVSQADVDLPKRQAWVSHTAMISAEDIAAKLQAAGYEAEAL
jgi:copper chaperone CopZ